MGLKQLRQRCKARLRTLDLPRPFDARSFCDALAAQRGRPIRLQPIAGGVGPFGVWVAGQSADYIFYQQETSQLHREHIILHEACHLLCDHHPVPASETDVVHLLMPNIAVETVRRVLRRAGYSSDEEQEAELLASLILERASAPVRDQVQPDPEAARLLERLESSLEEDGESA